MVGTPSCVDLSLYKEEMMVQRDSCEHKVSFAAATTTTSDQGLTLDRKA